MTFDHQALAEDIVSATTETVAKRSAFQGEKCIRNAKAIELIPNEWMAGTRMREVPLKYQQNDYDVEPPEEDEDRYSEEDQPDTEQAVQDADEAPYWQDGDMD